MVLGARLTDHMVSEDCKMANWNVPSSLVPGSNHGNISNIYRIFASVKEGPVNSGGKSYNQVASPTLLSLSRSSFLARFQYYSLDRPVADYTYSRSK